MAWSYVAGTGGYVSGSGTTTDADDTLHIEVGDLLVIVIGWFGATATATAATTVPDNSFTMCATTCNASRSNLTMGYVIVDTHQAAATIRSTLSAAREKHSFVVMQYRPDAGDTVTLVAGPSPGTGTNGTPISGNISPSGSDLLVIGGHNNSSGLQGANEQIGDVAADGTLGHNAAMDEWYTLYTSDQTNIHAQCTFGDTDNWVCDIIAFESAAEAGGENYVPAIYHMNRMRVA